MANVFLIQTPSRPRDLSSAKEYGKLRTVLEVSDHPSIFPDAALEKLRDVFESELKEGDYLLFAGGDNAAMLLAGVALAEMCPALPVRWLRWERKLDDQGRRCGGYYTPTEVASLPIEPETQADVVEA